ncbi:LOW QUALITY PROTEIN: putative LacI-family transcriptional regulatory protein, partial [Streptomyces himastatinicus ATCC 53653]
CTDEQRRRGEQRGMPGCTGPGPPWRALPCTRASRAPRSPASSTARPGSPRTAGRRCCGPSRSWGTSPTRRPAAWSPSAPTRSRSCFPRSRAGSFSDDQFFPGVVRGVGQELEEADKQLVLMMARSPAGRDRIERFAQARHVDGVMVASVHGADPLPAALARMGIPVVCNERLLGSTALPYVGVDNAGGAALAVRHLLGSGRTRVVTVAGPQDMVAGIDRLTGYRTALKEAGREPVVAAGDFTQESGAVAMRELLGREPELDAVFVASDLMGLGVLRALRQAGRRVPEDVAVVGFDDVQAARYADPPLTTVRQPIAEIGRRLARQLLRLAGGEAIEPAVVLDVELVLRGSA